MYFAGLHLFTRLWLGQSHLDEHRCNHNFQNSLHCLHYNDIRATLLNELKSVDENILKLFGTKLINLLFHGDPKFDSNTNTRLLKAANKYIIDSGRFTVPLVQYKNEFIILYFVLFLFIYLFFKT